MFEGVTSEKKTYITAMRGLAGEKEAM